MIARKIRRKVRESAQWPVVKLTCYTETDHTGAIRGRLLNWHGDEVTTLDGTDRAAIVSSLTRSAWWIAAAHDRRADVVDAGEL